MRLTYDEETRGVRASSDGEIIIYRAPKVGEEFVIGGDASEGKEVDPLSRQPESDFSALTVIERGEYWNTLTPLRTVVADYEGRIHPERFPDIIEYLCQLFFNAPIMIENNTHGGTVIACGRGRKIRFLPRPKALDKELVVRYGYGKVPPVEIGFRTTGGAHGTRARMLDYAHELVEDKLVNILSQRLIDRFETFVKDSKPGAVAKAIPGKHDDLPISFSLALVADRFAPTKIQVKMSPRQRRAMYERAIRTAKTMGELQAAEKLLMD